MSENAINPPTCFGDREVYEDDDDESDIPAVPVSKKQGLDTSMASNANVNADNNLAQSLLSSDEETITVQPNDQNHGGSKMSIFAKLLSNDDIAYGVHRTDSNNKSRDPVIDSSLRVYTYEALEKTTIGVLRGNSVVRDPSYHVYILTAIHCLTLRETMNFNPLLIS